MSYNNAADYFEFLAEETKRRTEEKFGNLAQESLLQKDTQTGNYSSKHFENFCSFDLKENHIKAPLSQKKLENAKNHGEKDVEYVLKWFLASNDQHIVAIEGDCESRHRYDCILLCKPDFINEAQEYDHILVTPAGVVLIETKHWKGSVEIRPDGKWLRKPDAKTPATGVESPKLQMRRHELVMQEILPSVPVHSILCFSNSSVIIDGRENFKDYLVITIDQLEDTLSSLCATGHYIAEEIDQMVVTINAHKTNIL